MASLSSKTATAAGPYKDTGVAYTTTEIDAAATDEPPKNYPTGLKLYAAAFSMVAALIMSGLDANILATAVPAITDHFHTVQDVGWYYTAYRLSACTLQFLFAKLYKMYPTKKILLVSQLIFNLGTLVCALSVTSSMLVVGRAITGIAIAGGSAGFFQILVDVISPQKRPIAGAVFGLVETITGIVAPVIGGLLTQHLSWRWVFWINLPVGGLAFFGLFFFLPDTRIPKVDEEAGRKTWLQTLKDLDIPGTVLLSGCLSSLFIAFNWAGITYSWSDPKIIALLVVAGVLCTIFVTTQIRMGGAGILPTKVARDRNVIAACLFSICLPSIMGVQEYYAPTYFQAVRGYSPSVSGYLMFPCLVGTIIGLTVQGPGTSFIGYYTPFMILSSVVMSVASGLMTTWNPHSSLAKIIIYFGLAGFGTGVGFMGPQNSVQTALSKDTVPFGIALVLFTQSLGPSLFGSMSQAIFTDQLTYNLHKELPHANVTAIENLGLTNVKNFYSGEDLDHIRTAIGLSISDIWYLTVALACLSLVGALSTKWLSVKDKKKTDVEEKIEGDQKVPPLEEQLIKVVEATPALP